MRGEGCYLSTMKPQKTKIKIVTKILFYRQAIAKYSMLALHTTPIGTFCNARMMHLSIKCGENTKNHILKKSVFRGFTV